ncbi:MULTISPECIES: flagellar biosynthetic protein FliR [Duganella]|jgi:flagellar biosynthetic protein FliR|uniref:Flagellar biosynthetic protein FliR n=3 Tax=Duganella TaxID=75654 RepID=A0ABW9WLZ8_9BURK|nr:MULTISPECIES: flagellar biosynthetic protein FliR [Duganella]MYN28298.1 flagellar biosynthetic protein FliR [Duganella levis]MYN41299.1 flagellar biosynthetic protein FliR [Duganella margarita]QJD93601.1 flagellar biosynthetic protein FliR [Duganella dendranthematis]
MEAIFAQLLPMLTALWWPFCRILAMFIGAPVLGEAVTPTTVRILIALVLAIIMMPLTAGADWGPAAINPFSLAGVVATLEQGLIGFVLGLAFHFAMSVIGVLGFMVSSQMGLSMAVMNDPMNGQSSDVTSALLSTLAIIIFFSIDGHLVIANVIGQSFRAWPLGHGFGPLLMQTVAYNVAWIFSAAMLLALPVVFSTMVVQIGFGFLNRVAPALNLFALGFSVITIFGLLMLAQVVRFIPEHYVRMTNMVLEMIRQQMQVAIHG